MQLGTELIKVLDHLGEKAGIAFDWSAEKIMPYIQDIITKVALYEKLTSFVWILLGAMMAFISQYAIRYIRKTSRDSELVLTTYIVFGIGTVIATIIMLCQLFDIIQAMTLPEITFYKYMQRISTTL